MSKSYDKHLTDINDLECKVLEAEIKSKPFKTSKDGSYSMALHTNGYYFYKRLLEFVKDCPLNKFHGIEKFLKEDYNIGYKELKYLVENDYINYDENQDLYSWE
jgi:hypothetical protein